MDTLKNVKISLRSDDLSNWISANPVLLDGEVAIAIDEKGYPNIKIGNGTDPFNSLLFIH